MTRELENELIRLAQDYDQAVKWAASCANEADAYETVAAQLNLAQAREDVIRARDRALLFLRGLFP